MVGEQRLWLTRFAPTFSLAFGFDLGWSAVVILFVKWEHAFDYPVQASPQRKAGWPNEVHLPDSSQVIANKCKDGHGWRHEEKAENNEPA
jgi:hypothetical protein